MRAAPLLAAALLASCRPPEPAVCEVTFTAMGTSGSIKVRGGAATAADTAIFSRLDALFSHWREDSPLSRFNAAPARTPFPAPPELVEIVGLAEVLGGRTRGAFDITAGSRRGAVAADRTAGTLTRPHEDTRIDLSAVAKGYAIDRAAEALEARGIDDYLIEFGGELRAGPGGGWTVGVEMPHAPGTLLAKLELRGAAIATSGTYRQGAHILDPSTGAPPPTEVVSATVLAPTAAEADAFATALAVTGEPITADAAVLFADGRSVWRGRLAPLP